MSQEPDWKVAGVTPEMLLEEARRVQRFSYSPYSGFPVGAAVVAADGGVFCGCNVENGSYGLTICAERNAMTRMISSGGKDPVAIAVTGPPGVPCPPCGACRQFLAEFNKGMLIVLEAPEKDHMILSLEDIFPMPFSFGDRG
jgi:cytidine deaminase